MAVHAPLLCDLACQDAMWSRAVAADSPAHDDDDAPSQAAQPNGGSSKEQFVQEFSAESPARLQSQQATLDALAAERAHQYMVLCHQVSQACKSDCDAIGRVAAIIMGSQLGPHHFMILRNEVGFRGLSTVPRCLSLI